MHPQREPTKMVARITGQIIPIAIAAAAVSCLAPGVAAIILWGTWQLTGPTCRFRDETAR